MSGQDAEQEILDALTEEFVATGDAVWEAS
jgi:hypothetical protein